MNPQVELNSKHNDEMLLFTLSGVNVSLANAILNKPSSVSVTPVSSTVEIIDQSVYFVDKVNKNSLLMELLKDQNIKNVLVFTRTKHGADKVVQLLVKNRSLVSTNILDDVDIAIALHKLGVYVTQGSRKDLGSIADVNQYIYDNLVYHYRIKMYNETKRSEEPALMLRILAFFS